MRSVSLEAEIYDFPLDDDQLMDFSIDPDIRCTLSIPVGYFTMQSFAHLVESIGIPETARVPNRFYLNDVSISYIDRVCSLILDEKDRQTRHAYSNLLLPVGNIDHKYYQTLGRIRKIIRNLPRRSNLVAYIS